MYFLFFLLLLPHVYRFCDHLTYIYLFFDIYIYIYLYVDVCLLTYLFMCCFFFLFMNMLLINCMQSFISFSH